MEFIDSFSSSLPIISAFLLGIITSVHPCPLTLNITAIGYISNNINKKYSVFKNGLMYTLGRMLTYILLSIAIYIGFDSIKISNIALEYGEKIIGPFLVLSGIIMLDLFSLHFPFFDKLSNMMLGKKTNVNSFFLGAIFSLAFCPHTILFFFGMLMPLTIKSNNAIFLPSIYAIGTGLPVILTAWIISFSFSKINTFYNSIKVIEKWSRKLIAIAFILVGLYFIIENFLFTHTH